jgi:hypothetical protein
VGRNETGIPRAKQKTHMSLEIGQRELEAHIILDKRMQEWIEVV